MEKRRQSIRKNPKMALTPIDMSTPMGALHEALWVSSLKCALASNPARS
jgi:hypothetical protein